MEEIDKECVDIFEEINLIYKDFGWSFRQLCQETFPIIWDNSDEFKDKEEGEYKKAQQKFYEKYKKLFQRKPWEGNIAKKETLTNLKDLQRAIYKTETYQKSRFRKSVLSLKFRERMKKISNKIDKDLKGLDYEE